MQASPPGQGVVALHGAPHVPGVLDVAQPARAANMAITTNLSACRFIPTSGLEYTYPDARMSGILVAPMSAPRLGRYELVRKIAAGGMAEIFLARQWGAEGFFRDVVIKRLFRHLAEHPGQLRMFQDEARLLAALSHPNIPQVYELGHDDDYWYIAMEHVDGWTLADVWTQGAKIGAPMPLPVAIGIAMQACEALHHAHERTDRAQRALRIVHRDVTPQNLMVTREGVVKLMDFGVAQTNARKDTEVGAVRGTFSYMAPEQVRARPLDKRADVFAMGVILYELTTGARLFRGSDVQVMTQVVEEDAPPPSTRVDGYPADLEQIVLGALHRDRARRTPSTAHIAWKLEELAQRLAMLVGSRAIARHVFQIIPSERVLEEALALVASERPPPGAEPASEEVHTIDEEGLLEDLQLLSLPPEPFSASSRLAASTEPPPALREGEISSLLATGLAAARAAVDRAASAGSDPSPSDILSLDDADESAAPVLLLSVAKKKSNHAPSPTGMKDYLRALGERVSNDDDEPR